MKKLFALCGSIATMLLFTPLTILAAESGEKQYCNSSDMALYPICRSVTLYRSTSACKTGMVGEKPAACRSRMVPVIYHSVCSDL